MVRLRSDHQSHAASPEVVNHLRSLHHLQGTPMAASHDEQAAQRCQPDCGSFSAITVQIETGY